MEKKFAVFVSGYGRGAIEIIKDFKLGLILPKLELILSSTIASASLDYAKNEGINVAVVEKSNYDDSAEFENHICKILRKYDIDYIFLAGWKYILTETLIKNYKKKIVNIHPSLLPSFKGLKAIDQALAYGVRVTGITTHFVDETIDGGEIIDQIAIYIEDDDNFKNLDNKIFKTGTALTISTINKIFR